MFGIIDLYTYMLGVFLVILLPGPNSLFCLTVGAQYGIKTALIAMVGIFIGDSILMLLSSLGASSVMIQYPVIFNIIKILGSLYLAYMGVCMLKTCIKKWHQKTPSNVKLIIPSTVQVFQRALLLSLLNPKAILFFISFFVQFVDMKYAHPTLSFFILAAILQIWSMIYLFILALSGSALVIWFQQQYKLATMAIGSAGVLFIGFAIKLWTTAIS